jgi:hypothetical protein
LPKSGDNVLKLKIDAVLRADGTPVGTAVWTGTGDHAVALRSRMQWAETNGLEQGATTLLKQSKWRGKGVIEAHAATDHVEPYVVKTSFDLQNVFFGKGVNDNAIPIGPSLTARPYTSLATYLNQGRSEDNPWRAGIYEASIDLKLPPGFVPTKLPADVDITAGAASYRAAYSLKGDVLHVDRRWVLDLDTPVLSKADIELFGPVAHAASKDAATHLQFTATAGAKAD